MEHFLRRHQRHDEAIRTVLKGYGGDIISRLSPEEQQVVCDLLRTARESGQLDLFREVWQIDYTKQPPDITQFLEDPEYFGHVGQSIYPRWKSALIEGMDPTNDLWEFIFRGCIGSGKSYIAAICISYELCNLLHMRNPQKALNLASKSDPIFLGLISTDKGQVKKGLWPYALGAMKLSPFFTANANLKMEQEYLTDLTVPFPNNIKLIGGSLPGHIIGSNLYALAMDEVNYRRGADGQKAAYDFYTKAKNRIDNRFRASTNKGRIILISSETEQESFLDTHCKKQKQLEEKTGKRETLVCQFAEWEVKPNHLLGITQDTPTFTVDAGDNLRPPKILEPGEAERPGARIIKVPKTDSYWKSANRDILEFIKERAGITPGRANKWFYNVDALLKTFVVDPPTLQDVAELAVDTPYDASDYVEESSILRRVLGLPEPKILPSAPRFIHVDLARTEDKAGFAMAHICDYAPGGSPIIKVELAIGFKASKDKPIDFDKIIDFIKWLRSVGFDIRLVTYDSWQSYSSQTTLEKLGFKVKTRSMDVMKQTPQGKVQQEYAQFRKLVHEGRILLPNMPYLKTEAVELENQDGKPNHDDRNSKDVLDACVGATSNALETFSELKEGDNFDFKIATEGLEEAPNPKKLLEKENRITERPEDRDDLLFT